MLIPVSPSTTVTCARCTKTHTFNSSLDGRAKPVGWWSFEMQIGPHRGVKLLHCSSECVEQSAIEGARQSIDAAKREAIGNRAVLFPEVILFAESK
jgi:hypothetical protein